MNMLAQLEILEKIFPVVADQDPQDVLIAAIMIISEALAQIDDIAERDLIFRVFRSVLEDALSTWLTTTN
jgi:hypothetical protein